ncbi:MAG: hypothetical protein CMJ18_25860 [Phycisphaeraceae bacterium]|nr:hypothetical protein [Phycisphaeraceae bacterium]
MSAHDCFYVSPDGRDDASGRHPVDIGSGAPFATLTAARDAVRKLIASGPDRPVTVMLLDGVYRLDKPLALAPEDSGTPECPVTWTAFPGDRPVLSGGRVLNDWQMHLGPIRKCVLPPELRALKIRQLFHDGQRQIRARWPKRNHADPLYGGWAFIEQTLPEEEDNPHTLVYEPADEPKIWSKPEQAEVNVFIWYCWINHLLPVVAVDREARSIRIDHERILYDMTLTKGNRFIVENVLEELSEPGEWCLDTDDGTVYFWPPEPDGQTVVPVADRLIELVGRPREPLHDVCIRGLTFTHTRSPFPDQLNEDCFHSPCLRGEAIRLENARDCIIERNVFRTIGGDGVRLHGSNTRNRMWRNEISDCGGSGISLASDGKYNSNDWTDTDEMRRASRRYPRSVQNEIAHNDVRQCGALKKNGGAVQVFGLSCTDNVIAHNHLHDLPDKAVVIQDGFGRIIVEYNDIHDVAAEISDTGAIMTNRWYPFEDNRNLRDGNIIRFNRIRNVIGCGAYGKPLAELSSTRAGGRIWTPYYNWGIYLDNSGMKVTIFGNLVIGAVRGGVSFPVGDPQDNTIENNILVDCLLHQADFHIGGDCGARNRFVRNVLYHSDPEAAMVCISANTVPVFAEFDLNVYGTPGEARLAWVAGERSEADCREVWRDTGFDMNSVIADPLFVDAEHGDYRLRPDSPAFDLGFQPLDFDCVGPQEVH